MSSFNAWPIQRSIAILLAVSCGMLPGTTRAVEEVPEIPAVSAAMRDCVAKREIAGAVTNFGNGDASGVRRAFQAAAAE